MTDDGLRRLRLELIATRAETADALDAIRPPDLERWDRTSLNGLLGSVRQLKELRWVARSAEPYIVTADICTLLEFAAMATPRDLALEPWMLLSPSGFAMFAEPIPIAADGAAVDGFAWHPMDGGIWWTPLVRGARLLPPGEAVRAHALAPTTPGAVAWAWPFGEAWDAANRDDPDEGWRLFAAFLLVMREYVQRRRLDRTERRAAARAGVVMDTDTVIVPLRRDRATATVSAGEGSGEWTHRWCVAGYFRRQRYASTGEVRQKYVRPHIKGPEHLPLVVKRRRFEARR